MEDRRFRDRATAGRELAEALKPFVTDDEAIVLGLPRGGVPVAYEVARELRLPLDVFLVRKLGVPGHEELAFGAIASGGVTYINEQMARSLRMTGEMIERVIQREKKELERRESLFRSGLPPLELRGKTVIVVDDGLATGSTMRAAVTAIKKQDPKKIIVAAPAASRDTCAEFDQAEDEWCVCVQTPEPFYAVGMWYVNFDQTTDEEVRTLLSRARAAELAAEQTA
jgi:putative phosphoribosyl transferase